MSFSPWKWQCLRIICIDKLGRVPYPEFNVLVHGQLKTFICWNGRFAHFLMDFFAAERRQNTKPPLPCCSDFVVHKLSRLSRRSIKMQIVNLVLWFSLHWIYLKVFKFLHSNNCWSEIFADLIQFNSISIQRNVGFQWNSPPKTSRVCWFRKSTSYFVIKIRRLGNWFKSAAGPSKWTLPSHKNINKISTALIWVKMKFTSFDSCWTALQLFFWFCDDWTKRSMANSQKRKAHFRCRHSLLR